jgi:hypothetical protein
MKLDEINNYLIMLFGYSFDRELKIKDLIIGQIGGFEKKVILNNLSTILGFEINENITVNSLIKESFT